MIPFLKVETVVGCAGKFTGDKRYAVKLWSLHL